MKKITAIILGIALAGGGAFAQEPRDTMEEATDQAEDRMAEGLSAMSAEELEGKTVVTASGEEVGEIESIGESETHQARVATIDVGGFLGVAEKKIAIPLSELEMSSDGNIETNMSKEAIETEEEFDETGFTEETSDDTGY